MEPVIIALAALGTVGIIGVSVYPAFRVMPFAYGSARLRAAKTRIIDTEELKSWSDQSYKDVVYRLEKKGFHTLIDLYEQDFQEELVQQSLRKHSLEELNKIQAFVPQKYKPFFRVMKTRNDYDLIITVLRSKINQYYARHIIEALFISTDNFTKKDLEGLDKISLDDFMIRLKKTPYYNIVSDHLSEIQKGNIAPFEDEFNRLYYKNLRKTASIDPVLHTYTRLLIDRHNILTALCFKDEFKPVKGGNLNESTLVRLGEAKDVSTIVQILDRTSYEKYLRDCKKTIDVYRAMYRAADSFAKKLAKKEPLSINPFVSYYISKEIELRNIRILLKLVHARFGREDINEAII
jgi:vacuolar-type H+-ATPase subunit C/Vma6